MSEKEAFLKMLDRAGIGHGLREHFDTEEQNPGGTAVQVEHLTEDNAGFYVTEWGFSPNGFLLTVEHYEGEIE